MFLDYIVWSNEHPTLAVLVTMGILLGLSIAMAFVVYLVSYLWVYIYFVHRVFRRFTDR